MGIRIIDLSKLSTGSVVVSGHRPEKKKPKKRGKKPPKSPKKRKKQTPKKRKK